MTQCGLYAEAGRCSRDLYLQVQPGHYGEGIELAARQFVQGELKAKQKRYNVFLKPPSTHELVDVSFFGEKNDVATWHESSVRRQVLEQVRSCLETPIRVQVYEVEGISGRWLIPDRAEPALVRDHTSRRAISKASKPPARAAPRRPHSR